MVWTLLDTKLSIEALTQQVNCAFGRFQYEQMASILNHENLTVWKYRSITDNFLEEDYITFLIPAPKCTNCIKQVELSKTDPKLVLAPAPQVRM
jgi:hypothetical protein